MKITIPSNNKTSTVATNYMILTDSSGSMYGSIDELKETILAVQDLMTDKDTITIGDFSGRGDYDFFVRGLPIKNQNISKLVNSKIRARGLTCYTEALAAIPKILEDVKTLTGNANFEFYFLSDGYPNDNSPDNEIFRLCKELKGKFSNAVIVGYQNYYNRPTLLKMAEQMGGIFNHVKDYQELDVNYKKFFKGKKTKKNIPVDAKYDLVWQVSNDIAVLEQNSDNSVDIGDVESEIFGINYGEFEKLDKKHLEDAAFIYSLAYCLSMQGKANLAVSVLRKAGAVNHAKSLQKSFTVQQKGNVENILKSVALKGGKVSKEKLGKTVPIAEFIDDLRKNLGKVVLNTSESPYKAISRKGNNVSKVEFALTDGKAKITDIISNENRANLSLQTVRNGQIIKINDTELAAKVKEYNKTHKGYQISLPIDTVTFRNYALIANGDFNFDELVLEQGDDILRFCPERDFELFDENVKEIKIDEFANLYKALLEEKAHASVLRYYIKNNTDEKHLEDLREKNYSKDAVPLLEEMGLDYAMRYSPKSEYVPADPNADYIPFTEITAQLKGASKISAKDSFEKYQKNAAGKPPKSKNPGDDICWPLFDKYEKQLKSLGKETFVDTIKSVLEGVDNTVDRLVQKISSQKFYLLTTNSWFSGVQKSDEFEHNGLVFKVKETKEYL